MIFVHLQHTITRVLLFTRSYLVSQSTEEENSWFHWILPHDDEPVVTEVRLQNTNISGLWFLLHNAGLSKIMLISMPHVYTVIVHCEGAKIRPIITPKHRLIITLKHKAWSNKFRLITMPQTVIVCCEGSRIQAHQNTNISGSSSLRKTRLDQQFYSDSIMQGNWSQVHHYTNISGSSSLGNTRQDQVNSQCRSDI